MIESFEKLVRSYLKIQLNVFCFTLTHEYYCFIGTSDAFVMQITFMQNFSITRLIRLVEFFLLNTLFKYLSRLA